MTSLIHLFPCLLFLAALVLNRQRVLAGKGWSRGWGLFPIWACFLSAAALLVIGGFQQIAHVKLEAVEMALQDAGKDRELRIGGAVDSTALADGKAAAIELARFPVDSFRIQADAGKLRLTVGEGWQAGSMVRSANRLIPVGGLPRLVPLLEGDEILLHPREQTPEQTKQPEADALDGTMTWNKGQLQWLGTEQKTVVAVPEDGVLTAGGGLDDAIVIPGWPAAALELTLQGEELQMKRRANLPGIPETWHAGTRKTLSIRGKDVPWSGQWIVGKIQEIPSADRAATTDEGEVTEVAPVPNVDAPTKPRREILVMWKSSAKADWQLPKRRVILPVIKKEVEVFSYLKWTDRVYSLSNLASLPTRYKSCVVFGAHGGGSQEPALLILDHGVQVRRAGKILEPEREKDGWLESGSAVDFLQLRERDAGRDASVSVVKRFDKIELIQNSKNQNPSMRLHFYTPEIKSVPLGEIKRDMKESDIEDYKVAFAINDQKLSTLQHQVKFRQLWPWFANATGEVEMRWLGITMQDDYQRKKLDFGETFTVGGKDKLRLKVEKMGIPWRSLALAGLAMVLTSVAAWHWLRQPAGMALFFGVAYLICGRAIFGQAVWVNAPYNSSVTATAWEVACILPPILSLLWWVGSWLKQGAPGRVLAWLAQRGLIFYMVTAVVLLFFRLLLLLVGFKEGIPFGGTRLALSIFFVPSYLLLFAGLLHELWERLDSASLKKIWQALIALVFVMSCQMIGGLAVSDLGSFLYLLPVMLVLVILAATTLLKCVRDGSQVMQGFRSIAAWFGTCFAMLLPALALVILLAWPKLVVRSIAADLDNRIANDEMIVTDSTLLRILHFADENYLINFGTDASEAILQDHAIMENYASHGFFGSGFLGVHVIPAKQVTALNDNVSAVYLLGQFGMFGGIAACIGYVALLIAGVGSRDRGGMIAFLTGSTIALVSLYMLAANVGMMPFTGRNMYLWGLNSEGDIAESAVLLALLVFSLSPFQSAHLRPLQRLELHNDQAS